MADIRLVKPQANAVHNVPCATGNRFVLDFPSDAALFAKDGDDLVLSFEDDSSIRLQDFYTTYSKEEMPSFEMEGAEISGEDFFAALGNPDLMPAAGPSAGAATRGGGFNQYGNVELLQGIDRLGGLDISFNWGQEHEDDLYAYGHRDIDYGVSVVPVVPGILDPDIPVVDDPDNPNDGGVGPVVDKLEVWEAGLENGGSKAGDDSAPTVAHGGMNISAPDGVATIVIGEVTVFANGHLVLGSDGQPVRVETGEGYLQVTGFNPATGRLEYTYTLTSATQEHELSSEHDDEIAHKLTVTVTDSDGDRGSSTIAVVIRDDEPTANNDNNAVTEKESTDVSCSGNVLTGEVTEGEGTPTDHDVIGADGHMNDASRVNWKTDGLEYQGGNTYKTEYGTIKLNADGTYEYTLDGENEAVRELLDKGSLTEEFTYTITDADGDTDDATLTITINGANHDVKVAISSDALVVDEAGLQPDGSLIGEVETTASASMTITAHDGLGTVTINGITVVRDGQLVENPVVPDEEVGKLTVNDLQYTGNGTWRLDYIYTLTGATGHKGPGEEISSDRNYLSDKREFTVEVTDRDGNTSDEDKATGTITVDIRDDVPYANSDFNAVTEGDPNDGMDVTAFGNVITGAQGEFVVDTSADIKGADGATVTGIAVVGNDGTAGNPSDVTAQGTTITGKYGTLTINPDGSYKYVLDENNREVMKQTGEEADPLKDIFSYTITDADGDSSTANLTITIKGQDHEVGELKFATDNVVVDEADLDGGNRDGSAPATETAKGSFTVDAKDGLQTLTIDGKDVQLSFAEDGSVTVTYPGTQYDDKGGNGYLTIDSVDGNSGSYTVHYTYHLTGRIEHAEPKNQLADRNGLAPEEQHKFKVEVKDQDGDSKSGVITVQILDDIPVLVGTPSLDGDSVAVSEDKLGTVESSVTIELGNAFGNVVSKYGADGEAKENEAVYSLRLSGESVSTNLCGLVGEGEDAGYAPISLVQTLDGVVQGVANATVCFTIKVDPKTGEATFTLHTPVQHEEGSDTIGLETVNGSLSCVYTITDADGDKAEVSLEIGQDVFKIDDAQTLVAKKDDAQLAVDESFAARPQDTTDRLTKDDDTESNADNVATFDAQDLFTITPGADDQGLEGFAVDHKFALKIEENGLDSGLQGLYVEGNETKQGDILLFQNEDGSIVGRVGQDGPEVFTLTIDEQSGRMTLTMSDAASIVHDEITKFDEAISLVDKIKVELTVTDRDDDTNTAEADVTLTFEDDGPALSMPDAEGMKTETDGNNMGTISGHMDIDFGADGPAQENAMVVTVEDGEEEYRFVCEQDADGTWFAQAEGYEDYSFTVDKDGNFIYFRPVSDGTTDTNVTITVTLTDGDGDSIEKPAVEYAPTITVDEGTGEVQEEGVAGHTDSNANAYVKPIPSTSGKITLAQSSDSGKGDSDELTLSLWGGSITHTTLTPEADDDADTVFQPSDEYNVTNIGNITDGMTLYLVKGEDGIVLSRENNETNSYGSITFTKDEGSDTWNWNFDLESNDLVNSMTEKEEIKLDLSLGVSDGMLQDDSGKITITIKGTNDLPVFAEGTNDSDKVGDNLVTDRDGGVSGVKTVITGTLKATDPDTDNGLGDMDQEDNQLSFSLVGFKESKVGTVGEDGTYTAYDSADSDRIANLQSNWNGDVEDGDGSTSITTKYGTLTVKPDGTFTYKPSDTSAIGKDEYVTETFTVRVTDAHGSWTTKEITITLRDGDTPVTGAEVTLNAKEEGVAGNDLELNNGDFNESVSTQDGEPVAGKGTVLFTDEDLNDTLTLTSTTSPSLKWNEETYPVKFPDNIEVGIAGTSTVLYLVASNKDGDWSFEWTESKLENLDIVGTLTLERTDTGEVKASFELDPQNITKEEFDNSGFLDQLVQNETVTVELPLQATSSGGDKTADSMLTINIEGTNDKPVIDSVAEKLTDKAEEYTYPTEGEDSEGSGESSGASEPDLKGCVTAHDVDMDNGSGKPTTANDGHDLVFTLDRDFACSTNGSTNIEESTFQGDDSVEFTQGNHAGNFDNQYTTIKTTYGTLEINPSTGEFSYTLDKPERDAYGNPNPIMELGVGQSVTETYTVRVTDSHGSWTESEIKITIEGTNDRPIITTQYLEVHGAEENTPDSEYVNSDTHPEEHSTAKVEAKDYDLDDTYSYLFVKGTQEGTTPIQITAEQLLDALTKGEAKITFDGDPNALLVLKAYLGQNPQETVATLNLAADGTLTLIPNQQSDFVQALNAKDSVKFSLSDVTGYEVAAKDSHDLLSDSVDVTLVLHGTDDTNAATSVIVPHVKEEGVYRDEENAIQETEKLSESAVEPGYGKHLASAEGTFTVHDKDAGQIVFKTKDGETVIGEETSTQFGDKENIIDFELSSGSGEGPMYVLGEYGYYTIQLDSVMDPDTGSKTFEYTYSLYSEKMPEAVKEQLGENLDDTLERVDSIPQGEKVQDPVTIKVDTGGDKEADLTLSATVSGSNDKPFINKVLSYNDTSEEGYTSLKVVPETQPDEPGTESTICFDKESGTIHITLQSNSNETSGKYIAQIKGLDPDQPPLKEDDDPDVTADGTTVVNYAFVYTNEEGSTVSNVWSIDGSEATSKYGTISIDAKGVIRIELNEDAGKDISQGEWEKIFEGLGVRCIDDLGATSEIVWLSGKLVGVDDDATAIASNESLWEGQHDSDAVHSPKPYEGEQDRVLADSEGHKLTGSISVTDPDKDDKIGSTVTVTIGQEEPHNLDFSEEQEITIKGENYIFTFKLEHGEGGKNTATLHYTYIYIGDQSALDNLNVGDTSTLEKVEVEFTSGPENSSQNIKSSITITAKGTNDAPVITAVNEDTVSDTGGLYFGGIVPARGQAEGNIEFSDVDNAGETYCGFLTYKDPKSETTYYLYGETGADGKTVYKAWYPSEEAGDFDTDGITYKDLVLTNHVELEHGTLYVDDQGHYVYSRKPNDTNNDPENVYVTVSDPHGAMDSVEIKFEFGEEGDGGKLPAIEMDDVTLSVIEPSTDGERVHAGEEGSYVSSFDDKVQEEFELTLYYTMDKQGEPQLVYRDEDGKFVDANDIPVENPFTATGTLVPDGEDGFKWEFKDGSTVIDLEVDLEIRFAETDDPDGWEHGSYSMATDYGTVYVDRETGEIRYELDSRADALNAGQKVTEPVAVWINGHQVGDLTLEVTGTGDASLVEAPALRVDLDDATLVDSGTVQIDDIDNSDTGNNSVNDTHTLEVTLDGDTKLTVRDGTSIYVVATEAEPGYKLVQTIDDVNGDSLYGTLIFTVDSEGRYHYTFTPADSTASKNLKDDATIAFEIPLTVTDTSPEAESEGDYNNPTISEADLVITLEGKADKPEITGDLNIGITEEGSIPEDKGTSAGPDSHAVQGKLVIEDYNEGYSISGVSGDESTFENGSTVIEGTYGTLVLKQDGSYTYTLKYDEVQSLHQGQEKQDTFTVKVVNGAGQDAYATIKVDVIGENDQPVVTVTPVLSVQEQHGTGSSVSGRVEAQDIDGDDLTYGIMVGEKFVAPTGEEHEASVYVYANEDGTFDFQTEADGDSSRLVGTLTMAQDGTYTFVPEDSEYVRALDAGESINFTIPVGAKDLYGDPVTRPVSITVHGSNENPEITTAIEISEDDMLQESSTESQYTLTIEPGEHHYSATDAEDGAENLSYTFERNGEYLTHAETTVSAGGKEYKVSLAIDENGTITLSYGDDLRAAIDALGKGTELDLSFGLNVVVQDGSGGKSSSALELTVTGDNDAPTDLEASVGKDGLHGSLSFVDVDATDEHTITFDGLYTSEDHSSSLSIETGSVPPEARPVYNGDGTYLGTIQFSWNGNSKTLEYTLNPDPEYLNSLPVEVDVTIPFSVTVADHYGGTATTEELQFSVVNENDPPVLVEDPSGSDEENEGSFILSSREVFITTTFCMKATHS